MSNSTQELYDWVITGVYQVFRTIFFVVAMTAGVIGGAVFHEPIMKTVNSVTPFVKTHVPVLDVGFNKFDPPPLFRLATLNDSDQRNYPLTL